MSAAAAPVASRAGILDGLAPALRRNAWILGLLVFLVALLALTKAIQPTYGPIALQGLGDVGAAAGPGRRRPGDRRHRRRDRPVDRLDDGPDERHLGVTDGGPESRSSRVVVVVGVLAARPGPRRHQRRPGRGDPRPRHRGHPGDVVRVGRLRAPGSDLAGRRGCQVADGPRDRAVHQRVGAQGVGRAGGHRGGHLDPDQPVPARPVPVRHRQQPAGGATGAA